MISLGFGPQRLDEQQLAALNDTFRSTAANALRMIHLANSGHPGGALSTLHALILAYANLRHDPERPQDPARDRIVVSHGHVSAGVYATLADAGYFPIHDALMSFRRAGTPFSGHVESCVPGVYWNTGNLGQGLSAAVGAALAGKLRQADWRTFVVMGDGEQQKGQIGEARRFAVKFGLNRLVAFVDWNELQISGKIGDVMPQDISAGWAADGWNVHVVPDGNDFAELYSAMRAAFRNELGDPSRPTVLMARTRMGHGVSFMEDDHNYHGKPPNREQTRLALAELGASDDLEQLVQQRAGLGIGGAGSRKAPEPELPTLDLGQPRTYPASKLTDCRSAYGNAMADLATANNAGPAPKVLALCCDLEGSVKLGGFHAASPGAYFEAGIQEHHTAALAGALSREGFSTFFSTFGVFGVDEVHNQNRLSDINEAIPRLVLTHCGLDVGEDGPTHQCIDYVALVGGLFGFDLYYPADPNQCDRIVRATAAAPRPVMVCMGRSKVPVLVGDDGAPLFGGDYAFERGKASQVCPGGDAAVFAFGPMVAVAQQASKQLAAEGVGVRVLDMASLIPLDDSAVLAAAKECGALLTVEDHHVDTGLGALVARTLADAGVGVPLRRLGVSHYGSSGPAAKLYEEQGLTVAGVVAGVRELLGRK